MGEPLRPLEQLMSVFPKQSDAAVPKCYRWLMQDSRSPVIDLYPSNFKLDVNGAAFAWMGVSLLPYIDMPRLLNSMNKADQGGELLTPSEKERNQRTGDIYLFYEKNTKSESALKRMDLNEKEKNSVYEADFSKNSDSVYG
jgi:5'-3' exoribonuclease 2